MSKSERAAEINFYKERYLDIRSSVDRVAIQDYEWYAVRVFYCAVHLVNAHMIEKNNEAPKKHKSRFDMIMVTPSCEGYKEEYRELYSISERMRYEPDPGYRTAEDAFVEAPKYLRKVEESIFKIMKWDDVPQMIDCKVKIEEYYSYIEKLYGEEAA